LTAHEILSLDAIYVLHAFQKKSKKGIATPQKEIELVKQRLAGAEQDYGERHVSGLMRGQSGNFAVGRLMDFLTALGQDVEITVRPTRKEHGDVSLALA
jgi:hypothetical protein